MVTQSGTVSEGRCTFRLIQTPQRQRSTGQRSIENRFGSGAIEKNSMVAIRTVVSDLVFRFQLDGVLA
jgi:hypothetical protein